MAFLVGEGLSAAVAYEQEKAVWLGSERSFASVASVAFAEAVTVDSPEILPPSVETAKGVYCAGQDERLKRTANIVPVSAPVPVMVAVADLHYAAMKPDLESAGVEAVVFAQVGLAAVEAMVRPGLLVKKQVSTEQANHPQVQLFQR